MDSEDFSFEQELHERRRATAAIELDSSIDVDASYPPPQRRTVPPRSGIPPRGGSTAYSSTSYSRKPRSSTPSPEPSDMDASLSGSMDHEQPSAYSNAMRSLGLSRQPSAISASAAYSSAGRPPLSSSVSASRSVRRNYEMDSSLEELNPENESDYVPAYKPPPVSAYQTMMSQSQKGAPAASPSRAPPASRRPVPDDDDEEISFEEDDDDQDVRASNNTLIKKAQMIQDQDASKERQRIALEQQQKEKKRQDDLAAAKRASDAAAEQRAAEERLRRLEEEEEERDRLEAEQLRAAAEIEDDYGDDEVVAPAKQGLDALDASLDADEDAEIERARRQIELEEEAELEAERRRDAESDSLALTRNRQLDTAAFANPPPWSAQATAAGRGGEGGINDLSFGDSADLDIARRRQEEAEEAEEDERREREQQQRRRESLEAAVEESYEDEAFDVAPSPPVAQPVSKPATAAAPAPSATARYVATSASPETTTPGAAPSVFAAALASLDPQVAALVMKAVADQMVTGSPAPPATRPTGTYPSSQGPYQPPAPPAPVFNPSQSRQAATDAWERLLTMRSAPVHPAPGIGPTPTLPQPPAAPTQLASWEGMLAAVSASQLARSTAPEADQFFVKRPQSFAGSSQASYAPPYPSSAVNHDVSTFNQDGAMSRYINQVLHSGVAEDRSRTHLRVENERDALRRLLTFDHTTQPDTSSAPIDGPSPALSKLVSDQKVAYLQDQAILNSVLRRVLTAGEAKQRSADLTDQNKLDLSGGTKRELPIREGVIDDGRQLPADDVIRMIEEGYPFAAHDAWRHFSTNTLARSVMLASEPPTSKYTRDVVEATMKETLSELLSDEKIVQTLKKACLKKLKHRLRFTPPPQHAQHPTPHFTMGR